MKPNFSDLVLPVSPTSARVAAVTGSVVTIASIDPGRILLNISSDAPVMVYIKAGTGCTSADHTFKMSYGDYYEKPDFINYTGSWTAVFTTLSGGLNVTEWGA
jgi:hypothetical protein